MRNYVKDVSLAGFRAAITRNVSHAFTWEFTTVPALLFLGTGQCPTSPLSQDTWFEIDESTHSVKYIVRLVNMDEEESDYGCDRAALTAIITMAEAADLLDMCIAQVHAEIAMSSATQALLSMRKDD